jgi:hypothetical protein
MKYGTLSLLSLLFLAPLSAFSSQQMIPAGALIQCTVSEPKLSSKTTAIGDPVLCQVGHSERFGRVVLPYHSFLVGRFEDYKDPGHFVGKGWMELKFDRMVVEPNTVIPLDAKVVAVPGYNVDRDGRILGKGHATRDTVMWSIPILWPIDLLMLPERGPRPTLKTETRLTLKVMDDLEVPNTDQPQVDPYGLTHRTPNAALQPPPVPAQAPDDAQQVTAMADDPSVNDQPVYQPQPDYQQQPVAPPPPVVAYQPVAPILVAPPVVMAYGGYGYAPGGGGYGYSGPAVRGYATARPMVRGTRVYDLGRGAYRPSPVGRMAAPRSYGPYGGGQRAYAGSYGGAQRPYAGSYSGGQRGYTGAIGRGGGGMRMGGGRR